MHRYLPYILKTLWRHRSRTLLTVSGAAAALLVFCFVEAINQGMNDLLRRQEESRALIVFQANKFCPATSRLPQDYVRQIEQVPGVRRAAPIQVFTNNCRASLDVVVFYGMPPDLLRQVRDFRLLAGDWSQFERHQDAALMGRSVAARRRVKAGDKFTLGEVTVTVAGVFAADDPSEENYIYTHLDFLQRSGGQSRVGVVTQIEALLAPQADPQAVCEAVDDLFRSAAVATQTRPKGVFQAKSLGDLIALVGLIRYLGYACVALVLALVATTTVMSVQDRVKEHAVLQTLGFSGSRIFGLVVAESAILSFIGGALGVTAAMIALQASGLSIGAEAVAISFRPSLQTAAVGLAVAVAAGVLAGILPAWKAATAAIVPALRQG